MYLNDGCVPPVLWHPCCAQFLVCRRKRKTSFFVHISGLVYCQSLWVLGRSSAGENEIKICLLQKFEKDGRLLTRTLLLQPGSAMLTIQGMQHGRWATCCVIHLQRGLEGDSLVCRATSPFQELCHTSQYRAATGKAGRGYLHTWSKRGACAQPITGTDCCSIKLSVVPSRVSASQNLRSVKRVSHVFLLLAFFAFSSHVRPKPWWVFETCLMLGGVTFLFIARKPQKFLYSAKRTGNILERQALRIRNWTETSQFE